MIKQLCHWVHGVFFCNFKVQTLLPFDFMWLLSQWELLRNIYWTLLRTRHWIERELYKALRVMTFVFPVLFRAILPACTLRLVLFLEWTSACILVPLFPSSRRWPDPFHCPVCPCCFSIWLAPVHLWWPSPGISSRNSHLLIKEIALPLQYSIPEQTSSLSQNISIIAIHVHQLNFEFLEDKGYIMYHVHVASVIVVPNTV